MPTSITKNNIAIDKDAQTWRPLRHFNYYRLTLALALLLFFYNGTLEGFLGATHPEEFLVASSLFFFSSLIYIFLSMKQATPFESQVILSNTSDILLITLMMHFSGGLNNSLSMLIIINIVATGTFLPSRESFLFAALASITVLSEQTFAYFENTATAGKYTAAGILGMVFFASSILASTLRKRLLESEALSSRRKTELINLEKLNEHIIQNMRTGILVVDNDGFIRMVNGSAEALLGNISLQEKPLLENISPALEKRFFEWLEQPQMHHKAIPQEQGLPDIQPGFQQIESTATNQGDTIIFLEDATQLNQRFQQIKLASLGRLTASIAHEIRNPLSAINHAAQLLNESELNTADSKLTQIINTHVQRLDKTINNVLNLSRQEASTPESIDLETWLINFRNEFCDSVDIKASQIKIKIKIGTQRKIILFDSSHLYQILNNLCSNAINHNNKDKTLAHIHLICHYDEDLNQPYLDIVDNGPGIDPKLAQQIFDPFFTTSSKGSGLGLYISKEIIEINRAKIRYIENNEAGSCFRIYFLSASKN
jgi:two-component system, NtrC family, sensor histidine kinase PilS